jgi:hypothetical protein
MARIAKGSVSRLGGLLMLIAFPHSTKVATSSLEKKFVNGRIVDIESAPANHGCKENMSLPLGHLLFGFIFANIRRQRFVTLGL